MDKGYGCASSSAGAPIKAGEDHVGDITQAIGMIHADAHALHDIIESLEARLSSALMPEANMIAGGGCEVDSPQRSPLHYEIERHHDLLIGAQSRLLRIMGRLTL